MLILLLCIIPFSPIVADHFDVVELNHFYSESGQHLWSQVIWREWDGEGFRIVDWRMADKVRFEGRTVRIGEGTLHKVTADEFRETWTQHDPESRGRDVPRRGLTKERK